MLPGYLLGRRVGNREQGEEKGKEYTSGKLRVALSLSKTREEERHCKYLQPREKFIEVANFRRESTLGI